MLKGNLAFFVSDADLLEEPKQPISKVEVFLGRRLEHISENSKKGSDCESGMLLHDLFNLHQILLSHSLHDTLSSELAHHSILGHLNDPLPVGRILDHH